LRFERSLSEFALFIPEMKKIGNKRFASGTILLTRKDLAKKLVSVANFGIVV